MGRDREKRSSSEEDRKGEAESVAQPRRSNLQPGQEVPDGALVGQAQAGDQRAFEALVNRYHRQLASYIRSILKDGDQIADVLQQVYIQLYLSLPTLLTDASLRGWLFQVARNRCLDELRRRRAETPFSRLELVDGEEGYPLIEAIPDPGPLLEEAAEQFELSWSLHAALVSLPQRHRLFVYLRCFRQLTFAEVGSMLNMRESTAKMCFHRALSRLWKALAVQTHLAAVS
jgi:RNA polymerase sigma factor (sigma-70 family)